MAEADKDKTAFSYRREVFRWNVMSFELCNASATFQTMMNSILAHIWTNFDIVYLDNILVMSETRNNMRNIYA